LGIKIPLIIGIAVVGILLFSFGTNDEPVLDEPTNSYQLTPTTSKMTITTATIEPTKSALEPSTAPADVTIESSSDGYSGLGFVFPILQESFGIGPGTNTLDFEDWDMGVDAGSHWPAEDESGGIFDGNVYTIAGPTLDTIYRLNPSTNVLTTWTIPVTDGFGIYITVNSTGHVFFAKSPFAVTPHVGLLDPFTDEITLWDMGSLDNIHQLAIDPTTNIIYGNNGNAPSRIFSLDPKTNELKVWNVESICNAVGFAFTGLVRDAGTGKIYANQLERPELCELDPATNLVTLYDTGLDFGRSWASAIDPTNTGHVFLPTNLGPEILRIDTVAAEATIWTLTGLQDSQSLVVDSIGNVWIPTTKNGGGSDERGIVRLDPDTNIVTEWAFGHSVGAQAHWLFAASDGDIWEVTDNTASGTNDHLVRFFESP